MGERGGSWLLLCRCARGIGVGIGDGEEIGWDALGPGDRFWLQRFPQERSGKLGRRERVCGRVCFSRTVVHTGLVRVRMPTHMFSMFGKKQEGRHSRRSLPENVVLSRRLEFSFPPGCQKPLLQAFRVETRTTTATTQRRLLRIFPASHRTAPGSIVDDLIPKRDLEVLSQHAHQVSSVTRVPMKFSRRPCCIDRPGAQVRG